MFRLLLRHLQGEVYHMLKTINPLSPELNSSVQRCLPRFLLGILIFKGLTARGLTNNAT
jgi:hypothetical protein